MPGSYGSVAGDNDNDDDLGEGDITMVEPHIDLTAVNDKLAGFKASEFELDYVDQGIGTESPTYSDVEIDATSPSRPLALLFGVKYAMARRAVEQRDEQIAVQKQALDDADVVLKGLAVENAELREHVSDQEDIIGNLEAQRDADAERHQVELAQKDELLTDALEGQAVVQAELKHKTGLFEIMRPKYDALKDLVKGLRGGLGIFFEAHAGVAEILDEDENIYN
ncbi:hypothetical protein SCHPADRAFT_946785 [Schizopora paradoxa]|uniref:Uncharacterized protein n=1 Tax=Schizopora paradoxa TaxID=27342 RepID=A0A0H2R2N0_9AGAM|nr:hypothetical protein SCHPADRAFT_946785 [Schizopora paradoxa]